MSSLDCEHSPIFVINDKNPVYVYLTRITKYEGISPVNPNRPKI